MPKMKRNKAMAKRIKVSASGKLLRLRAHRKAGAAFASTPIRSTRYGRQHAGTVEVAKSDAKRVKRLLGR
jgi:large subunit ribosomal protein L35